MTRVIREVKYKHGMPIIKDFFPREKVERCGTCVHLVEYIRPTPPSLGAEHVYTCKYANNLDNWSEEDILCEEYKQINPFKWRQNND